MRPRLSHLFSLLNTNAKDRTHEKTVEEIIALIVHASLPVGLNGLPPAEISDGATSLVDLIARSTARWERRLDRCGDKIDVTTMLSHERLSREDVQVLSGLIYSDSRAREACYVWLSKDISLRQEPAGTMSLLHSTLDAIVSLRESTIGEVNEIWKAHFEGLVENVLRPATWSHPSDNLRNVDCIVFMVSHFSDGREELFGMLRRVVEGESLDVMSAKVLDVARRLQQIAPASSKDFSVTCVDHGLQWAARHFASDEAVDEPTVQRLGELGSSAV